MFHTTNFARIGRTRRARLRCGPLKGTGNSSRASRIRWSLRPQLEWLERRTLLSGTTFSDQQSLMEVPSAYSPWVVTAADMDRDGDQDLLYCGMAAGKVAWYENRDGKGSFTAEHVVSLEAGWCRDVLAADLDSDGDLDVVSAGNTDDDTGLVFWVVWYENVDGLGTFGSQLVLRHSADSDIPSTGSIRAADLDHDGDLDVVSSYSNGPLVWFANTNGEGNFGPEQLIGSGLVRDLADLDGDGDLDVLSTGDSGSTDIRWYENTDGRGHFSWRTIGTSTGSVDRTRAVDLDGDGDLDVLFASRAQNTIGWCENTDGQGSFGPQRVITRAGNGPRSVFAGDLDGDGDLDVLSSSQGPDSPGTSSIDWYENTDGTGNFGAGHAITRNVELARCAHAADLDGDGDLDVISASGRDSKIAWYENLDARATFGPQVVVVEDGPPYPIVPADMDGDGDLDLLSAGLCAGIIAWYENTDGTGKFGPRQLIARFEFDFPNPNSCFGGLPYQTPDPWPIIARDIDGDGDLDVVASSEQELVWYENMGGAGTFSSPHRIGRPGGVLLSLDVADIDGDADLDVFYTNGNNVTAWHENLDGAGNFGPQRVIARASSPSGLEGSIPADFDSDGDLDAAVVSIRWWDDGTHMMQWDLYENVDGRGTFGSPRVMGSLTEIWAMPLFSTAADLDGDGDLDLVFSYDWMLGLSTNDPPRKYAVAWFENTDGAGQFGPLRTIAEVENDGTPYLGGTPYFAVTDLDADGDQDLVSQVGTDLIGWYENTDGAGSFRSVAGIVAQGSAFNAAVDLDHDDDVDILATSLVSGWLSDSRTRGNIVWYENLLPHAGDANRDGRFDSVDFVQVFQAGEYEDDIAGNSTWEEGDWDGNGDFDSADFVIAFQTGLYEVKSQAAGNSLAAAVDWLFAQDQRPVRRRAYVT